MTQELHQNEIRDYLARAPERWSFDGGRMVNTTFARLKWLSEIAMGTIDQRINRRAGVVDHWAPWRFPIGSAVRRHARNELRKKGLRPLGA